MPRVCPAAASSSPMRDDEDKRGTITYSRVSRGFRITFAALRPIPRIFIAFFICANSSFRVGKKRNITATVITSEYGSLSFSRAFIKRPTGVESIKYFPATIGSIKRRTINAAGNTMPPKKPASCGIYESAASTPKKRSSFTAVFACPFKKKQTGKQCYIDRFNIHRNGKRNRKPHAQHQKVWCAGQE